MSVIDKYIANLSEPQKTELFRVHSIIKKTIPDLTEVISYGMPVFRYKHKYLIGFAAFKNHMSLFPGSSPIESLKDKLKDFKTSKGTIQFTKDSPLPQALIIEIINIRKNEIDKL